MAFAGFSGRELDVLALFVNGARAPEIAELLGISRQRVHVILNGIYAKTGMREASELKQWAVEYCLNETLAARPPAGMPKVRRQRIKLGRIKRPEEVSE